MARQTVNIELRATGGNQVADEFGRAARASGDFVVNIKKIGNVFGELGGTMGDLISNIAKGGIWGIMNAAVAGAQKLLDDWFAKQEQAEERAATVAQKAYDKRMQALADYTSAAERASAARKALISQESKLINDEISSMQKLTKASLEAERAMARARGDTNAVAALDSRIAANDSDSERRRLEAAWVSANKRIAAGNADWKSAQTALSNAREVLKAEEGNYYGRVENGKYKAVVLSNKQREVVEKRLRAAEAEVKKQEDRLAAASREIQSAKSDKKKARADIDAFDLNEATKAANAELDAREKAEKEAEKEAAAAAKKTAEERQKAEIAAAKAAAAERERLDREAHQKRMADIRAEIAEQTKTAGSLRAVAASAQSEFDKAFAMYRDPSRAEAEIGEEKAYRSDLERLHKDARRYGGKWRIDELSALMAAGDTQGVSDTLASWRKSKGFTPQVEAMVRASAAESAKTTAEDELRKLNNKTNELSQQLEQLAQSRDGKLDGIERNTNQLASKLDELLTVKG